MCADRAGSNGRKTVMVMADPSFAMEVDKRSLRRWKLKRSGGVKGGGGAGERRRAAPE